MSKRKPIPPADSPASPPADDKAATKAAKVAKAKAAAEAARERRIQVFKRQHENDDKPFFDRVQMQTGAIMTLLVTLSRGQARKLGDFLITAFQNAKEQIRSLAQAEAILKREGLGGNGNLDVDGLRRIFEEMGIPFPEMPPGWGFDGAAAAAGVVPVRPDPSEWTPPERLPPEPPLPLEAQVPPGHLENAAVFMGKWASDGGMGMGYDALEVVANVLRIGKWAIDREWQRVNGKADYQAEMAPTRKPQHVPVPVADAAPQAPTEAVAAPAQPTVVMGDDNDDGN